MLGVNYRMGSSDTHIFSTAHNVIVINYCFLILKDGFQNILNWNYLPFTKIPTFIIVVLLYQDDGSKSFCDYIDYTETGASVCSDVIQIPVTSSQHLRVMHISVIANFVTLCEIEGFAGTFSLFQYFFATLIPIFGEYFVLQKLRFQCLQRRFNIISKYLNSNETAMAITMPQSIPFGSTSIAKIKQDFYCNNSTKYNKSAIPHVLVLFVFRFMLRSDCKLKTTPGRFK